MIYLNNDGTTKSSFQIGPQGIALSSTAVISDPTHLLRGYKKLTATHNGRTDELVYDVEIPAQLVQNVEPDEEDPNIYIITLCDRKSGKTRQVVINAGLGKSGVAFNGETAKEDNLASFSDTTGKWIKDSGYSVYASDSLDESCKTKDEEVPTVSAVYNYVGEITDYLKNRLKGKL